MKDLRLRCAICWLERDVDSKRIETDMTLFGGRWIHVEHFDVCPRCHGTIAVAIDQGILMRIVKIIAERRRRFRRWLQVANTLTEDIDETETRTGYNDPPDYSGLPPETPVA